MELVDQLKDFYCQIFGLTEGYRPSFNYRGYWLYAGQKPIIHLAESDQHGRAEDSHLDHIAFRHTGLATVMTALDTLGVDYKHDYLADIDLTQIFLKDPAGVGIEINFHAEKLEN